MKTDCPRLIEVALPIREISAESVRDKSLRHGHISTLHLWWARRPLAASRAVVFASVVPDPDDPNCPEDFRQAVERLLKTSVPTELQSYRRGRMSHTDKDPYRPYDDIPDTLRNRLMTFIAKWSPEFIAFEAGKRKNQPKTKEMLDDRSLVKWETSDPDNPQGRAVLEIARELITIANDGEPPTVLDPFAGGGAIPLEAGRLGCKAIANDYNPVAYLILKGACEFPQKYGKPGTRKLTVTEFGKQIEKEIRVPNILVYDLEKWAGIMLERARERIGHLYPEGSDGRPVVGYLWARTAPCSNPSCRGEMPLIRSLLICNKDQKKIALEMQINKERKLAYFSIVSDEQIERIDGTKKKAKGPFTCPFCNQATTEDDVRNYGKKGEIGERLLAVIVETPHGKAYRSIEESDIAAFREALGVSIEPPREIIEGGNKYMAPPLYGMKNWGSLFNPRQLVAMQTFVQCLHEALKEMKEEIQDEEYRKALGIYLGLWVSRIAQRSSNVGIWHTGRETLEHPFGRQAIPMTWDYPEANPFSESTGGVAGQLEWMTRVIIHESDGALPSEVFYGDAAYMPQHNDSLDYVVTDPPYFDAIAYSDLSDYFYVWFKRSLANVVPEVVSTPLTPKGEEATALRHRHQGNEEEADKHFTSKLGQAFLESHRLLKPGGVVSIMFAHQSTKAWSALVHGIFEAGLTIDATWPIDTELITALKASKSALSSSVTVICRPRISGSAASFKAIRKEIEEAVQQSIKRFWGYGFRGADLIVSSYGPAVGVFGKYERVEKGDGTPVEIPELLEFAKQAARDAIAGEFHGDTLSTIYYVWANLYGISDQDWDDARLIVQMSGDEESAREMAIHHGIFIVDGSTCRLALLSDRGEKRGLGTDSDPPRIDALHKSMFLWKEERRPELVEYLSEKGLLEDGPFWMLAEALFNVLPRDLEDWKIIQNLIKERETLRTEGKRRTRTSAQPDLFE